MTVHARYAICTPRGKISSIVSYEPAEFMIQRACAIIIIFRGIFIHNLEKSGRTAAACLFIPALFFSVVHITNLAGPDAASAVIQLVYSFAVGLVPAAVYLRNRRIMQVIVIHFLIDFTNRIYIGETASSTTAQIVMFAVLLLLESAYAIALTASDRDRRSS